MKRSFLILVFIIITAGIASAETFVFIYNAEKGEGFVYKGATQTSALVIFYPSTNKVFMYSARGQDIAFADDMLKFLLKYGIEIDASARSYIKPYPGSRIIDPFDSRFK